jgi:hypothetical protein
MIANNCKAIEASYANPEYQADFHFVIKNEDELNYAKSLLNIEKFIFRPFFEKNK